MELSEMIASFISFDDGLLAFFPHIARILLPTLTAWLLYRCIRSMFRERYEPEVWAYVDVSGGNRLPVRHWECTLGRSRSSDIVINYPTVSRSHAVLMRGDQGQWLLYDLGSKGGTRLNNETVTAEPVPVRDGDALMIADVEMEFLDLTRDEQLEMAQMRKAPGRSIRPVGTFLVLTMIQLTLSLSHCVNAEADMRPSIAAAFAALSVIMWCYYLIIRAIRRTGFEVEAIAFFLSTLGLSVVCSSAPDELLKQIILIAAGIIAFILLGWWLRDLGRTTKFRWPVAIAALALLAVNLLFSDAVFGANNWLEIGGFSLQPSEFVKVAFIYVGAATLDRLFMNRNLFMFIGFSAACVGALAIMGDFGTALIFFATFLVISFMRSGNLATVFLAVASAGLAGFLVLSVKPYIASRFSAWGHVWDFPYDAGYQQTRAMSAAASGGLFGQGASRGWLTEIFAADTDMAFAVLCEELGLIMAIFSVVSIIILAAFAVRNCAQGRSSFYVIASCSAMSLLMVQLALNVFGSLDILPFTGVTFPFVSRGGSSLISCWMLLAFVKASDTRKNASFVVKPPWRRIRKKRGEAGDGYYDEEELPEAGLEDGGTQPDFAGRRDEDYFEDFFEDESGRDGGGLDDEEYEYGGEDDFIEGWPRGDREDGDI